MQKITVTKIVTKTKDKCVPSIEELEKLTGYRTYAGAGRVLGVSRAAVQRWFTAGMSEKNYNKYFGSGDEKN